MRTIIQDLRYGARILLKQPGLALVAVMALALGIGANLTILSFVDTMFFRPLPVRAPYQLVSVEIGPDSGYSYPVYKYFRDHTGTFAEFAAHYSTAPLDVAGPGGDAQTMRGAVVSANYFSVLGLNPALGRFFSPEEDAVPDRDQVVVISHGMWQSRFSGDPAIVGKEIQLNGSRFTIIGVAAKDFEGASPGYPNDLWIPTMMLRVGYRWCDALTDLRCVPLTAIGRLAPDRTLENARAEMTTLSSQWISGNPAGYNRVVNLNPALGVRASDRPTLNYQLRLMMLMTGVLLLIACANVAGLLLTAGTARRKEISVRLCIGAGRARLIRQFLTESLWLTLAGGGLGLLFSLWAKDLLLTYYTTTNSNFRMSYDLSLNPRTFVYALALTIGAGFLYALAPAIQCSRQDLVNALKDESSSQSRRPHGLRGGLVIGQVALSLGLLVSAGLMVRSVAHLRQGENFDPQNVIVLRLRPKLRDYAPEKAQAVTKEVLQRLQATPGVQSVSLATSTLAWLSSGNARVRLPEQTFNRVEDQPRVQLHEIAPRLLETLRIPLVKGRDFDEGDRPGMPRVAIINETLAQQMWPNRDALERGLMINDQAYRVVGVVRDAQFRNATEAQLPFLYLPYWQSNLGPQTDSTILARVAGNPEGMLPILGRQIAAVDPNLPISESATMTHQLDGSFKRVLLTGSVLVSSAAIALFLSVIGLYTVVAFMVSQRTREIGIRMALGARTADVLKLVVGQGFRLVSAGLLTGLLAAFAATRVMKALLYGVSAIDPISFGVAAAALLCVGVLACWIPARRATKVDPLVALRYE
ncbi:MAG TPA: ABC transporter permease [Pyrinomonadaceae bacterium]|nr:ABC transporter permease [Pyrinomonadaceae bacterium]